MSFSIRPLIRIVDDSETVRESLSFLLECEGYETAAYESAETFLAADAPSRPGCLIIDLRMEKMSGLDLQMELSRRRSLLPMIFLTGHGDIETAVEAMREGAFDFQEKPVNPPKMLASIAKALEADRLNRGLTVDATLEKIRYASLTERERSILTLAAGGLVSREIAAQLGISRRTVEHYRASALKKIDCTNAAQAAGFLERNHPKKDPLHA